MKSLKTILPICLVGVMAPTVAIVATSCGSSSTILDVTNTSPNQDESFSFNNGQPYTKNWSGINQTEQHGKIDPNFPKPYDFAKSFLQEFDFQYQDVKGSIDKVGYITDELFLKYILDNNLIDANVLAFLIVMDTYQFVWSLEYNINNAANLFNEQYLSNPAEKGSNVSSITNVNLTINKITSHYNQESGYTYDVDFDLSTNLEDNVLYSCLWAVNSYYRGFDGFTLTYGHATGTNLTLSVEYASSEIGLHTYKYMYRFSDGFKVTKPDQTGENPDIYRFLTNSCSYDSTSQNKKDPYFKVFDLIDLVYPNISK